MKITAVDTFVLNNRRALVKISTDEGVVGWGEPVLENWVRPTISAVERMAEYLIGENPLQITRLWQVLARGGFYRGGSVLSSAVAGIDQALWDIKGRWHGVPVHELLGGPCRDSVRIYSHANTSGRVGDLDRARELVATGMTMLKVAPDGPQSFIGTKRSIEQFVHDLTTLRDTVGDDVDIAIDLHGRFSIPNSIRLLRHIEPVLPVFVEEPLRPEHSELIGQIVRSTSVPIATGERLYSRYEFRPVCEAGIAVAQPDLSHAGGITECFRIATQAEIYDVQIAPHCPLGPLALAACLQVDFAVPNFLVQEQILMDHNPRPADLDILLNPEALQVKDGHITRLTGPGLGLNINEDAVRARVAEGPLDPGSPVWAHADGSFAEW